MEECEVSLIYAPWKWLGLLLGCPKDSPVSLGSGYFIWMCLGVGESRSLSLDYIVSFQYADWSLCKTPELFTFFIYVLSVWLLIYTCLLCLLKTNQVRGAHHRCVLPMPGVDPLLSPLAGELSCGRVSNPVYMAPFWFPRLCGLDIHFGAWRFNCPCVSPTKVGGKKVCV